jgi:hypothetical protein
MSTGFSILPASTSIPLDAAGKGSASFTVTNQTGHAVRVRVGVTVLGDPVTPKEWIIPPEVTERDLAIDGAQQFAVLVAVPPKSPGGTYLFRLDAVSTVLPDEEWAHSPEVHFVVPEPEKEPEPEPDPKPPVDVRKGYVESLVGCLLGAFVAGLAVAIPLRVVGLLAGDGDVGDLADVIRILLTPVAFWVGGAAGVIWNLRRKGFERPYETAVPTFLIFIPWAVIVLVIVAAVSNAMGEFPGKEFVLEIGFGFVIAFLPPLVGRAIFRYRTTKGL